MSRWCKGCRGLSMRGTIALLNGCQFVHHAAWLAAVRALFAEWTKRTCISCTCPTQWQPVCDEARKRLRVRVTVWWWGLGKVNPCTVWWWYIDVCIGSRQVTRRGNVLRRADCAMRTDDRNNCIGRHHHRRRLTTSDTRLDDRHGQETFRLLAS